MMLRNIKRVCVGVGFLVLGIFLSSLGGLTGVQPAKLYEREIARTNCMLLFSAGSDPASAALPGICQRVDWLLPAGLIANGVAVMLFGLTKATSFISILNLVAFAGLYCNPWLDSSFVSFSHLLEVGTCVGVLGLTMVESGQAGRGG